MPSLYNRATPSQARILRIIEGAVLNTADAHGESRDAWAARSIAKRATGTLTAQWPEVLAANSRLPAKALAPDGKCRACERRAHAIRMRARNERIKLNGGRAERRASQLLRRSPLLVLWERLKREMWHLKHTDQAKFEATRDLLRMIDRLRNDTVAAGMIDI